MSVLIDHVTRPERSSGESRILNCLIEKNLIVKEKQSAILMALVSAFNAAEEDKKIDVLAGNQRLIKKLSTDVSLFQENSAALEGSCFSFSRLLSIDIIQYLFSYITSMNDSFDVETAAEVLTAFIAGCGLSDRTRLALEHLSEQMKDVIVKKASDLSDRVDAKHAGICNLGCICYLLSVMQQFFMIPAFRQGILQVRATIHSLTHSLIHS